MTHARLLVDIPPGPWIGDISRRYPDATFQVLTALPGDSEGFALVWIRTSPIGPVLDDITDHETLTDLAIIQQTETAATIQIETTAPMILLAAKRSGIPVEMPVRIQNGKATVDVSGSHERLSELGHQFSTLGLDFEVVYIQERLHPDQLLTDTQRELLLAAHELGYYESPRRCTLTELAGEVGIAKSTCSETLHRAEGIVIDQFVESLPPPAPTGDRHPVSIDQS